MGWKRVLLFITLLSSIYPSVANVENSEPKIKTSHYPWMTIPCALLVLALANFLNLSVINYIKDRSPINLTILLMLYKEFFYIILVSNCNKIKYHFMLYKQRLKATILIFWKNIRNNPLILKMYEATIYNFHLKIFEKYKKSVN